MQLTYTETPVFQLNHPVFIAADLTVRVKAEYLNHPLVSGNKWWKLKYNIQQAVESGLDTLLTFGGPYSNHIYATAAAAREAGLKSVGIIRGEVVNNPTLQFAADCGMELNFVTREDYRKKSTAESIFHYRKKYPTALILPEGGTNRNAIKGVREFANEILSKINFDYIVLPVGTGGTIAGLIEGLPETKTVIGVSALKGNFLETEVKTLLNPSVATRMARWQILNDYHAGGYGKVTDELLQLIVEIETTYGLPLDPVYTGKAMRAMLKEIESGRFPKGSEILFLHTGGLQGRTTHLDNFRERKSQ